MYNEDDKNQNKNEIISSDIENKKQSTAMPIGKLLLLLLITFTLYTPFWFYYKWKYLRDVEKINVKPLLLTLTMGLPFLNFILPYFLFKDFLKIATLLNKWKIYLVALLLSFTMTYFLMFLYEEGSIKLLSFLHIIPILIIQLVINRKEINDV